MKIRRPRPHFVKHHLVSSALRLGASAGKAAESSSARDVVRMLRPTGVSLVRIGSAHDGGYLLPDDLEGIEACFSPGVAEQASFELDLAARGIPSFMIDGSVADAPVQHELLRFEPLFLDVVDGAGRTSLQEWVDRCAPESGDLMLQMDIEGAEWTTLLSTPSRVLERFRIVVLELHEFEKVFDLFGIRVIRAVLEKLLESFVVVHVHPNNYSGEISNGDVRVPRVPEVTFLRRDRLPLVASREVELPHLLDEPNSPFDPDLRLSPDFVS